jgi:excisionase family DNA binding protein
MSARAAEAPSLTGSVPTLDEGDLVERVLARDERAWHQLVRRFEPLLRSLIVESEEFSPSQIDDVLGDLWLRLMERDMRRLRAFAALQSVPLSAWLAMQVAQVAFDHAQKRHDEPEMVALDHVREIADTRRPPAPAPRLMRVEEVAERWDLNVKTVYAMIERGELVSRRCGRLIRVPRHVVESFEQASVSPDRSRKPCR